MYKVERASKGLEDKYLEAARLIGCREIEFRDTVPELFSIDVYVADKKDIDRLSMAYSMLVAVVSKHDEQGNFFGFIRKYTDDEVKEACQ